MLLPSNRVVCLACALLLFVHGSRQTDTWPEHLPRDGKYHPQDEAQLRRQHAVQQQFVTQRPAAVRKMSADAGEKFLMEYWHFDPAEQEDGPPANLTWYDDGAAVWPSLKLHEGGSDAGAPRRLFGRSLFGKRDFQCPGDTTACASINRPNSCCPNGQQCILVADSGLGDVGCCPPGSSCTGNVLPCDRSAGYSSCPSSSNGGCCIPKYQCQDVGCVSSNTVTTTTTITPAASPSATACTAGFQSCPASLGGGCCPADRACGPNTCPPLPTTTTSTTTATPVASVTTTTTTAAATANPPLRPTNDAPVTAAVVVTPAAPTSTANACPTGFYMCSAVYRGGCCRVDRNCDSASCPPLPTNTVVSSGVTVVAPDGATVAPGAKVGTCPSGWFTCPSDAGGGCCPSGFGCGASCTASGGGGVTTGKIAPASAAAVETASFSVISLCLLSALLHFVV